MRFLAGGAEPCGVDKRVAGPIVEAREESDEERRVAGHLLAESDELREVRALGDRDNGESHT